MPVPLQVSLPSTAQKPEAWFILAGFLKIVMVALPVSHYGHMFTVLGEPKAPLVCGTPGIDVPRCGLSETDRDITTNSWTPYMMFDGDRIHVSTQFRWRRPVCLDAFPRLL